MMERPLDDPELLAAAREGDAIGAEVRRRWPDILHEHLGPWTADMLQARAREILAVRVAPDRATLRLGLVVTFEGEGARGLWESIQGGLHLRRAIRDVTGFDLDGPLATRVRLGGGAGGPDAVRLSRDERRAQREEEDAAAAEHAISRQSPRARNRTRPPSPLPSPGA